MKRTLNWGWPLCAVLLLSACAVQAPPITQQPMAMRPQPLPLQLPSDGSIFQAASYKPMFEDQVPVRVGDILTVTIQENNQSSSKEDTSGKHTGSVDSSISASLALPFLPGSIEKKLAGTSLSGTSSASETGKTSNANTSTFSSSITVTVIDVYPNGNLLVSGEKQMKINSEHEFIRLSGVVNPRDIKQGNTVESTRMADARIEQINQGRSRAYNETGWLQKVFLSVLPF